MSPDVPRGGGGPSGIWGPPATPDGLTYGRAMALKRPPHSVRWRLDIAVNGIPLQWLLFIVSETARGALEATPVAAAAAAA